MTSNQDRFVQALLGLIAQHAAESGHRLTKTRLVKFLYLLDLYYAQSEKRTLTGWPWAFVHYGPYCRQSTDAINCAEQAGVIAAKSYESQFSNDDYKLYAPGERLSDHELESVRRALPTYVWLNLAAAIQKWGGDTFGLLNHVYFHTGPMEGVRPNDLLSFENEDKIDVRQFRPLQMRPLSASKKKAARDALKKVVEAEHHLSEDQAIFDDAYFDFISQIEGEETPTGLAGTATLRFDLPDDPDTSDD